MLNENKCFCRVCGNKIKIVEQTTDEENAKFIFACPFIDKHPMNDFVSTVKTFFIPKDDVVTTDAEIIYSRAVNSGFNQFVVKNNNIFGLK